MDDDFDGVDEQLEEYETAPFVSAAKPRRPRAKPSTGRKPGQTVLPVQKVEGIVKGDCAAFFDAVKSSLSSLTHSGGRLRVQGGHVHVHRVYGMFHSICTDPLFTMAST